MISVEAARQHVMDAARPLAPRRVGLERALGRVLAAPVTSDIDSPPYDKSLVDGYALLSESVRDGAELKVLELVTAGQTPRHPVGAGEATRIMTGAPIPAGADAVVMVERTEMVAGGGSVRIRQSAMAAGENILRRGAALRQGELALPAGRLLRPMEIGLLAELGAVDVPVHPQPQVAILATGEELVEAEQVPGPGQIRNSNAPMLAAMVQQAGARASRLGIARDQVAELRTAIAAGLQYDVLLTTGGVSAGVSDLTPGVLCDLGVQPVFHKVDLKPGKPLWFGIARPAARPCLVFGLPGNPVSSLVSFHLFVRPALALLAGGDERSLSVSRRARLTAPHHHRGDRPTYFPASCIPASWSADSPEPWVTPLHWKGSADLRTLVDAQALIVFPAGERSYAGGEWVEVVVL